MKKFLEEFKSFALRGNVMDMAVGAALSPSSSYIPPSNPLSLLRYPLPPAFLLRFPLSQALACFSCASILVYQCEITDY